MLSQEQRSQRARIAGLTTHARGRTNTLPAKEAAEARFAREVATDALAAGEQLTPAEITRRAGFARQAFYARLAFESSKARSARAASRRDRKPQEAP